MANKKNTELAPVENFSIVSLYENMDPELMAELQDEMADLDAESGIDCRTIKLPAGGGLAYEVQGDDDDDVEYLKEITGVIIFTHRANGFWPGSYGSGDDGNKIPLCSSMDGKTGMRTDTGEIVTCESCPYNQFGSAADDKGNQSRGKACKNMRRLYIMRDGNPNIYLLTVPPTSIKEVNKQLMKIMGSKGIPYTDLIIGLKLEKATNANGIAYSKVVIEKKGLLPAEAAAKAKELRRQIKEKYQSLAITMDDYSTAPPVEAAPASAAEASQSEDSDFEDAAPIDTSDLPFN